MNNKILHHKTSSLLLLQLVNLKKYSCMSVQYSRGCPFSCEFCDIIEIYGRVPRTKSNQQILAEFDALKRLGWRECCGNANRPRVPW